MCESECVSPTFADVSEWEGIIRLPSPSPTTTMSTTQIPCCHTHWVVNTHTPSMFDTHTTHSNCHVLRHTHTHNSQHSRLTHNQLKCLLTPEPIVVGRVSLRCECSNSSIVCVCVRVSSCGVYTPVDCKSVGRSRNRNANLWENNEFKSCVRVCVRA